MSEFAAQVQCYCAVDTEGHLWSPAEGCTRSPVLLSTSRGMSGPYDFEFPTVPPAVCNRCGATVQKRDLHDEWHDSVVTRDLLLEVLNAATRRENYDQ